MNGSVFLALLVLGVIASDSIGSDLARIGGGIATIGAMAGPTRGRR